MCLVCIQFIYIDIIMNKSKKQLKKTVKIQKVKVADKGGIKRGLTAICNIEKDDFITFYAILPPKEQTIISNKMNLFVDKQMYEGDPSDTNKLALGQFANDNAYEDKIIDLILEGEIQKAHNLYKQNCIDKNNALISKIKKKPCLIATKMINAGETIYTSTGLSYWIYLFYDRLNESPYIMSRLNTYSLQLPQQKNTLAIFFDPRQDNNLEYKVKELNNEPIIIHNNEKCSEGIALIILCKLYKLNQMYYMAGNLPSWIYDSPYKSLLYLNIVMGVIPKETDSLIFDLMLKKDYKQAYMMYLKLDESKSCSKYVNEEDFIYYYKRWTDLFFTVHKNKLV